MRRQAGHLAAPLPGLRATAATLAEHLAAPLPGRRATAASLAGDPRNAAPHTASRQGDPPHLSDHKGASKPQACPEFRCHFLHVIML